MSDFVLDNSITMTWAFEDEESSYAEAVLESFRHNKALVPAIWPLEVTNVLVVAQRNQRLRSTDEIRFVQLLRELPISRHPEETSIRDLLDTARETSLSAYDASYLHLALIQNIPLATIDKKLRNAAIATGVELWLEN